MSVLIPIRDAGDRDQFGGKAANLAFLAQRDLDVPEGRVVPAAEFTRHVAACGEDADAIEARPLSVELGAELRALVTELVCREYRIPCVTGVAGALSSLQSGQRLRVDGTRGGVELVAG
jgi:phosphoenolpyruvate synthase/pyruvate phosphate dikinase